MFEVHPAPLPRQSQPNRDASEPSRWDRNITPTREK